MDEVLDLEVGHPGGYLRGHVEEHCGPQLLPHGVAQEVQHVAVAHELCDDVEGGLPGAHACNIYGTGLAHMVYGNAKGFIWWGGLPHY